MSPTRKCYDVTRRVLEIGRVWTAKDVIQKVARPFAAAWKIMWSGGVRVIQLPPRGDLRSRHPRRR